MDCRFFAFLANCPHRSSVAVAVAITLLSPLAARANPVTFVFDETAASNVANGSPVSWPLINDAAILTLPSDSGQINYSWQGTENYQPIITGDTDFSLTIVGADTTFPITNPYWGDGVAFADISLRWAASDLSGIIDFGNGSNGLLMTISDNMVANASAGSDGGILGCPFICDIRVSGTWSEAVPGPASAFTFIGLCLAAGIIGIRNPSRVQKL